MQHTPAITSAIATLALSVEKPGGQNDTAENAGTLGEGTKLTYALRAAFLRGSTLCFFMQSMSIFRFSLCLMMQQASNGSLFTNSWAKVSRTAESWGV